MFRLSKSKINDYIACPRMYYLKNFTQCGELRKDYSTSAMEDGSILHNYYELYNKYGHETLDIKETLSLNQLYKININNFHNILNKFSLDRAVYSEEKIIHNCYNLSGIVDAIYKHNGKWCLIDYKTGKYHDYKKSNYRFELGLYVMIAQPYYNITIDEIGMFYTNDPENSFIEPFKQTKLKQIEKKYWGIYDKINNHEFDCTSNKRLCSYCQFVDICNDFSDDLILASENDKDVFYVV